MYMYVCSRISRFSLSFVYRMYMYNSRGLLWNKIMILHYVSLPVLVCKLHPSRVAQRLLFPVERFNNKSTLRIRSLFPSPLFHSRFCFFDPRSSVLSHSLSPSLALFLVIVAKQKALHSATENASSGAQPADYIVKCIRRRNYEAVDLCAGCLLYKRHFAAASLNYGLIIGRRIIKKLSRLLSGAHRES